MKLRLYYFKQFLPTPDGKHLMHNEKYWEAREKILEPSEYDFVGEFELKSPEDAFREFNIGNFGGLTNTRSMCVGDFVSDGNTRYLCASVGWKEFKEID